MGKVSQILPSPASPQWVHPIFALVSRNGGDKEDKADKEDKEDKADKDGLAERIDADSPKSAARLAQVCPCPSQLGIFLPSGDAPLIILPQEYLGIGLMTELRALIFDVDGTLADTERDGHRPAFNRAFAEAGLDWDWSVSLYGELLEIAGGKERIRFYLNQYRPDFKPPTNIDRFIADLHAAKTKHYQKLVAQGAIPLRPGVKRLLEEARTHGLRLAIATTAALPNVTALLQQALAPDAPEWFEVIAAGDIVPAKKPAPDIYQYVLREMGEEAQDCLAFEDSHHGLKAAASVGLKTVVTVNDYTRTQDFSGAKLVLNHLGEPDLPFTVLACDAGDMSYLNLALVHRLHNN